MLVQNLNLKEKELVTGIESVRFNNDGIADIQNRALYSELTKLKNYIAVSQQIDYKQYSLKELEDIADKNKIKIPDNMTKKADIIELLKQTCKEV